MLHGSLLMFTIRLLSGVVLQAETNTSRGPGWPSPCHRVTLSCDLDVMVCGLLKPKPLREMAH